MSRPATASCSGSTRATRSRSKTKSTSSCGKRIPLDVKAGDRILFGKYSGSEVKIEDEEYLILREEDVLAILE
jgi:co-chaperonin GroES (HSP10)